jgi:hypothetical protein
MFNHIIMDIITTELTKLNSNISSYLSYLPKDMMNIIIDLSRPKSNKYYQQYIFKKIYKLQKYLNSIFKASYNYGTREYVKHTIVQLELKNKRNWNSVKIIGKLNYLSPYIGIDIIELIEYPNDINQHNPMKRISMYQSYDMKFEFHTIFYSEYSVIDSFGFNVAKITRVKNE